MGKNAELSTKPHVCALPPPLRRRIFSKTRKGRPYPYPRSRNRRFNLEKSVTRIFSIQSYIQRNSSSSGNEILGCCVVNFEIQTICTEIFIKSTHVFADYMVISWEFSPIFSTFCNIRIRARNMLNLLKIQYING